MESQDKALPAPDGYKVRVEPLRQYLSRVDVKKIAATLMCSNGAPCDAMVLYHTLFGGGVVSCAAAEAIADAAGQPIEKLFERFLAHSVNRLAGLADSDRPLTYVNAPPRS